MKGNGTDRGVTIYLHIGHGKTGSTSIQRALAKNVEALRAQGVYVADKNMECCMSDNVEGMPLKYFRELKKDTDLNGARKDCRMKLQGMCDTVRSAGGSALVVSSENLASEKGAALFEGLKQDFTINVIYYVRRQDEWFESAWKQWGLKSGEPLEQSARKFIEEGKPDYLNIARMWKGLSSEIRVMPFDSVSDVTQDFWSVLSLKDFEPESVAFQNQTFDWSVLDILSKNPFLFDYVGDNRVFDFLNQMMPDSAPRQGRGILSTGLSEEIMSAFREENEQLQNEFFPEMKPLHQYPGKVESTSVVEGFGSIGGVHRYLGVNLLMLLEFKKKLDNALARSQNVAACKRKIASLEEENRKLNQRLDELSNQVSEQNKKMLKLPKIFSRNT